MSKEHNKIMWMHPSSFSPTLLTPMKQLPNSDTPVESNFNKVIKIADPTNAENMWYVIILQPDEE